MSILQEKTWMRKGLSEEPAPVLYRMSAYPDGARDRGRFHLLRFEEGQTDRIDRFIPHRHDFYELIWLPHARGRVVADFRAYPVLPRSVFFASPGQVHSWDLEPSAVGEIVSFTPEFFFVGSNQPGLLGRMSYLFTEIAEPLFQLEEAQAVRVETLFKELRDASVSKLAGRDDLVRSYLTIILTLLRQAYHLRNPEAGNIADGDSLARRFRLALETHFPDMLEVGDYAQLLQVSRSHLNDELRRQVGQSASEIIHQRLVLEAKRLLVHSTLTISETAYRLGFQDPSYFGRFFRRYTGQTPGMYRDEAIRELMAG